MSSVPPEDHETSDDRILVELYCLRPDCQPVEDLVSAVVNSVRWKDRIDLRVEHLDEYLVATTPYGPIADHTVVVCGTHILRGTDYGALTRALEDCIELEARDPNQRPST